MAQFDREAERLMRPYLKAAELKERAGEAWMMNGGCLLDHKWMTAIKNYERLGSRISDWCSAESVVIHPSQADQAEQIRREISDMRWSAIYRAYDKLKAGM